MRLVLKTIKFFSLEDFFEIWLQVGETKENSWSHRLMGLLKWPKFQSKLSERKM